VTELRAVVDRRIPAAGRLVIGPVRSELAAVLALALVGCSGAAPLASSSSMRSLPPTPSATPTREPDPLQTPAIDGIFPVDDAGRGIALRCWGDGPVIILEGGDAGIGQFGNSWLARELAAHALVCAHDRAGIGSSDPAPDRRRDADDVVEDLRAALAAAGVDPPFMVVGSSFGGMVVTHFADRFDDEVSGVVTLDTPAPSLELTPENFPEGVWDHPDNTQHLDVVEGFENRFAREPPTFRAPLIVITASGGQSDTDDQAFWLQSSPDSRQVELPGGHEIYVDNVGGVVDEILSLLPADAS
jgi:pimeloyl-ACP methyl ester carboxylesterase